jgi:Cdc6-like AAA superfamily ATPase
MTSKNQHIENYLNYYFNPKFDANFAVMISGEWGCGKTWFIKQYCKSFEESRKEKGSKIRFVYVSLNGLTSFTEIEDQIFEQLHPFRASKGFVLANKLFKSFLRSSIRLDLDFDKDPNNDGSINIAPLEAMFDGVPEKPSDCFIIFDDFERCRIEIESILGYINLL